MNLQEFKLLFKGYNLELCSMGHLSIPSEENAKIKQYLEKEFDYKEYSKEESVPLVITLNNSTVAQQEIAISTGENFNLKRVHMDYYMNSIGNPNVSVAVSSHPECSIKSINIPSDKYYSIGLTKLHSKNLQNKRNTVHHMNTANPTYFSGDAMFPLFGIGDEVNLACSKIDKYYLLGNGQSVLFTIEPNSEMMIEMFPCCEVTTKTK